jgi:putative phosphoesterase
MVLGILSDIHDNIWKLAAALEALRTADVVLCCGDLCSPFIVHQLGRGFGKPIHVVFGNNDGDLYRITANARNYPHILLHGELFRGEFDGKAVAMVHYDSQARPIAASGAFDLVAFGHNHAHEISTLGRTLAVNPGAIMGAKFAADGTAIEVPSTYAVYDTAAHAATCHELA